MSFDKHIHLCNSNPYQDAEHCHHPQESSSMFLFNQATTVLILIDHVVSVQERDVCARW